jgi:DNA invertase Pin-like site-specific DNA recombinase
MQAVIYLRVSTEQQANEGVSLEAQLTKLNAWAALHDANIIGTFNDAGISGMDESRPGLAAAMQAATEHQAALVVYSLSRLSRSTSHCIKLADQLNKAGANLVSLSEQLDTTSAAGRMVFKMLAVLAEFERDQLAERTRNAMQHKRTKGERVGTIPFGYNLAADGINLEANAEQLEAVDLIRQLRQSGLSYQAIADELTKRQIPTAKGNARWTQQAINRICKRAA